MKKGTMNLFCKYASAVLGGLLAALMNTSVFALICFLAVLMDCWTAWRLSRRVRKNHPGVNDGKFKSRYAEKIISTFLKVYALILLMYLIDTHMLCMFHGLYLANFTAAFFCFIQIWSMLENESSENGVWWAKILQRIMVNKAERHFDIELTDLKKEE
jgi:hypothetical protein